MKKKSQQANNKAKLSRLEKDLANKKWELKIETALEKVRNKAMRMKSPDDMLVICRTISIQLEILNVKNIRNVQTAIIYESKGTYFNYEYYAKHKKLLITEVDFKNHHLQELFVNQMINSTGELFTRTLKGKEVQDWYKYQKTTNQFADTYLEMAKSLSYYWFSIGPVALGTSTYNPLSEKEIKLFKRFRNVFELAYRRFLDIEKAVAQTREAQIEASLERVRAVAMSMHKSEDLLNVCEIMYLELHKLGFDEMRNAMINIHDDEKATFVNYDYSNKIGKSVTLLDYNAHPVMEKQIRQSRMANDAFSEAVYKGKDLKAWKEFRRKYGEKDDPRIKKITALYYYFYSIGNGTIGISTFSSINDEKLTLLKRFRNVFNLAYKRYSDISLAEAQAREAQIEASLERVRAVAMGMNKSDDLLSICEVSFKEFKKLGFDNIRNALIHIQYDEQKYFMDYDFSDLTGGAITKIEYGSHPVVEDYLKQIRSAKDAFYQGVIKEEQLEEWKNFRRNSGQIDDPRLEKATALYYYFFSIGMGDIGISTLKSIDESQIKILKRFRNVFDLAYRRYNDITLAEAQAREAKIEASLEKVRAVAMGMNKPDDLLNICEVMFKELQSLRFNKLRNTLISTYQDDKDYFDEYDYSDASGGYITKIPYSSHPALERFQKQIWRTTDAFEEFIIGEDQLNDWKEHRRSNGEPDDPRLENISALYYYFYSIGPASIGISTFDSISEEMREVLKRFRNVFDLAYRRYSDITLAESQAREAKIEAALEKVRATAMSMMKPDDLLNVCEVLFTEFHKLGIDEMRNAMINIHNDEKETFINYDYSDEIGRSINQLTYNIHPVIEKQIKQIRSANDAFSETSFTGKDLEGWKKFRQNIGEKNDPRINNISALYYYFYSIGTGLIGISTFSPIGEEKLILLKRFGNVFSLSYQRYSDLALAEAQAREAQIEAALERVRSRTMGMQKSDELKEVIRVVYEQFVHLKINVDHAGFVVDYTPKGDWHFWIADEQDIPSKITHPYFESVWANQFNEAKEKGADFFATNLNFEEKNKFYNELLSYVPGLPEASKDFYLSCPGLAATTLLFDNVSLYIENFSGIPYSDEENKILIRFGKVFQQTYTRFLDLEKAEAQAREAQIEASLEKVRTVALSLKKSDEMLDIAEVLYKQCLELGFTNIRNAIIDIHSDTNETFLDYDYSPDMGRTITLMSYYDDPIIEKQVRQIESSSDAFFEIILEGQDLQDLIDIRLKNGEAEDPRLRQIEQLTYNLYSFGNGAIGISNFGVLSDEQKIVLKRFRNVFAFAYKRYNDLLLAETQAREAQIEASLERIRAKAMSMHISEDLSATVNIFFKELKVLGIIPIRCGVGQIDDETRTTNLTTTTSSEQGESFQVIGKVKQTGHPVLDGIFDHWKLQKEYHPVLEGEDIKAYYDVMNPQIGYPDYPKEVTQYGNNFYFKEGFVFAWTESKLSEEELGIFRRLTSVLSLTYRRYLDLKEAEAQAREAQIQLALERVRARTMAMQNSNELVDTSTVLFHQLKILGIESIRTGVATMDEVNESVEVWSTSGMAENFEKKILGKVPANIHPMFTGIFNSWKNKEPYFFYELKDNDLKEYYKTLSKYVSYPEQKKFNEREIIYTFFFAEGSLNVVAHNALIEEECIVMIRFANVFGLVYTRFLDLKLAEAQNKIIQADNDRKTKELEEARQLQLSLLPKAVPRLPYLEIAVYMKTATEVGGDYYDFKVQENGVLNLGFGDATGHGLQAGTMITLMKGFFTSDAARFSPQKFLEHCNSMIRDIKLGRILMSFSHLRFDNSRLMISSAGMPPIYYHHKKNNRTEEIMIQGMPLGAMQSSSYNIVEKKLNSGDTILLLTDGLPEQMNSNKAIFDYSRVLKYFSEIAENTTDEIINSFVNKADEWMMGTVQTDDMTFVVIKVK